MVVMPAQHARAGMTSGSRAETAAEGLCGTPVYTPQQVRRAEQPLLAAQGLALMQSAAFAVAVEAADMLRSGSTTLGVYGSRVLVLVGAGNNGGDALFAAAELARRGAQVRVVASSDSVHAQGAEAARRAGVRWLDSPGAVGAFCPDLIVDGLLGIGAEGPLRGSVREVIDDVAGCAAAGTPVLAVDLPSGADPMGGAVDPATLVAQRTVTFGGVKPVHVAGLCAGVWGLMSSCAASSHGGLVWMGVVGRFQGRSRISTPVVWCRCMRVVLRIRGLRCWRLRVR